MKYLKTLNHSSTICFVLIINFLSILGSCNYHDDLLLNETFNENNLGWIEESTDFHNLEIDSGFYFIKSIDTSASTGLSSTGVLDKSFLFGLPDKYEITTSINLIDYEYEDVNYGIFLYGASLKYSFKIYKSGKAEVLKYDYNLEKEETLISRNSKLTLQDLVSIKILIDTNKFRFFIENYEIGAAEFRVKSLQELRLYTSNQSSIAVDYIRISKTN